MDGGSKGVGTERERERGRGGWVLYLTSLDKRGRVFGPRLLEAGTMTHITSKVILNKKIGKRLNQT